jgi:hypothetical protein
MRRLIILAAVVITAAGAALAVHVTRSDAKWHILSGTAINTNKLCVDGLRYTWASGSTATQPPATRPVGTPRFAGPIDLVVQHAPSTTPNDEADWFDAPLAGADVFTADYKPVFNPDAQLWYPYSHTNVVAFRHPLTPTTESVRLDTQPNGDSDATDAFEAVNNCFLFGRIDFQPATAQNTVDFSKDGTPKVALFSSPTFNAAAVNPSTVLFGQTGTEAAPIASSTPDVDGDGRNDLLVQFQRSQTGILCGSTEVLLSAADPKSGKRFYERDSITTSNCTP